MAKAAATKRNAARQAGAARGEGLRANAGRAGGGASPVREAPTEPLLEEGSGRDIAGVVLAVIAVASFIAVVAPATAPVTAAVAGFYHLGFGLGGYVLPLFLLAISVLLFLRGGAPVDARTVLGGGLIFVAACTLLSLMVPGTDVDASAMFTPQNLSASGGYLGAYAASFLQGALGKVISVVIALGVAVLGMVVIGLSISGIVQTAYLHAEQLAQRGGMWRQGFARSGRSSAPVNGSPWGDEDATRVVPGRGARSSSKSRQATLFDDDGSLRTTFLGDRETTVLASGPDNGEDPLVDIPEPDGIADSGDAASAGSANPQGAAKRSLLHRVHKAAKADSGEGKTRLIPVRDKFASDHAASDAGAAAVDDPTASDAVAEAPVGTDDGGSFAGVRMPTAEDIAALAMEPADDEALPWNAPNSSAEADGASAASASTPEASAPAAIPSFLNRGTSPDAGSVSDRDSSAKPVDVAKPQPAPQVTAAMVPAAATEDADGERQLPPASMLRHSPHAKRSASTDKELEQTAASLQSTLQEFGLRSAVVGWIAGPTVTTFKVQPGEGERVSRINSLEDDIALTLATDSVRIFAPIPGTSLVGIEIPNRTRQVVEFGDILPFVKGGPLEFALGRDAEGSPMVADLAKMPHLLIAGTTGSGKSVVISSIVMSLLMRTFPEDVRLIMIDPKRVEFAPYDGLPHLYVPVVTEPKQAASALQWAVSEMERRLKIFERIGVRKIATFNEKQAAGEFEKYDNPPAKMPYLVIVIDELSDLMMVAGKDVEASIVRIAQLGRAAGIHMIVATQRPSSNVVTGLIKANITNRIGLTVATGVDSRVILDQTGAEKLTGQGDMLFSRVDWGKPKRIQGCYVSDEEIASVVDFVKEHCESQYHEEILSAVSPGAVGAGAGGPAGEPAEDDPLLWDAARIVVDSQLGSTSGLQRRLKVGYARAGRIMDMLEEKGVVGPPDGSKPREVLLDMEALQALEALESPLTDEEIGGGF